MAVVAGVVLWHLQVAPLDPDSGPDSGPRKNVGGSESGSGTVVRMHSCSMVAAVDYIHAYRWMEGGTVGFASASNDLCVGAEIDEVAFSGYRGLLCRRVGAWGWDVYRLPHWRW